MVFFIRIFIRLYKKNIRSSVLYFFGIVLLFYVATFPMLASTLNFKTLIYFSSMFIFLSLFMYVYVYTLRNLPLSTSSFFLFSLNLFICLSFIFGISYTIHGLPHAIYIEDISQAAYYRYCIYIFIVVSCIPLYFINKNFYSAFKTYSLYQSITYPYLKEETRKILYSWNETFFGPLFTNFLDRLYSSPMLQKILFSLHFILCYFIKILQIVFFFNFVFFHGDLRFVLFLLPFSFLSWIFEFFSYYFETYIEHSLHYISEILSVQTKIPLTISERSSAYILKTENDFIFTITPFGYTEGFFEGINNSGLNSLANSWLKFQHLSIIIRRYKKFLYFFNVILLSLRILCWFGIIIFPFMSFTDVLFTNLASVFRVASRVMPKFPTRGPSEAYSIKRQFQAQPKTQAIVVETNPVKVDSNNLAGGKQSTARTSYYA